MTSVTSDEVNYLVLRYLLESGFTHAAFSFAAESGVSKADVKGSLVPPGSLVRGLQRGLLYSQVAAHINPDGTQVKCVAPFTLLGQHTCELLPEGGSSVPLDIDDETMTQGESGKRAKQSLQDLVDKQKLPLDISPRTFAKASSNNATAATPATTTSTPRGESGKKKTTMSAKKQQAPPQPVQITTEDGEDEEENTSMMEDVEMAEAAEIEDVAKEEILKTKAFEPEALTEYKGHSAEVFACAWNPSDTMLATGSGDGTARIWTVSSDGEPLILPHAPPEAPNRDVTTLDWTPSGDLLATGSYEGIARVWGPNGTLKHALKKHAGPIFALKWSPRGDALLTGSVDKSAIVWDPTSGDVRQQFAFHSAPCLDVDWRDDDTFATCSNDKQIFVCQLGALAPLKQFSGHKGEVNSVRWDPSGTYLASCSDDFTVKVWTMDSDSPKCDFTGHEKEIYTIRWNPSGSDKKWIATGSFDFTVRVFDVLSGTCLHKFTDHQEAVYTVCFSPDSLFLASGSFDQTFKVRDMTTGKIVKAHDAGNGGVFEVAWSHAGDRIAVCYSNSTVLVVNVKE